MKKDEAAAIGILALLGIGVAVFAFGEGEAKAAEPDEEEEEEEEPTGFDPSKDPFKPTPNEPVPSVTVEVVEQDVKIPLSTLFVGGGICQVDNEPYNTLNWPSPAAVAFALTALGYPVSSDIGDFEDIATVKDFQVRARSLFLKGMQNAPANMIDGVVGPCTLRALTEASRRFNAGTW